jgi:acetyltransferase-like isoleucine patch superfamily enzyme
MTDVTTGSRCSLAETATVGVAYDDDAGPTVFGDDATVRAGTIVYGDVEIGDDFTTGHNALVREETRIGDDVLLGTNAVIDGRVRIGSHVSLQTGVYLPRKTVVGDEVFLGPYVVCTNDPYPIRLMDEDLSGPRIEDHVSVGANATLLPGVSVGEGSFVGAGSVVTGDVPPETLAVGVPARHEPLPPELRGGNSIA